MATSIEPPPAAPLIALTDVAFTWPGAAQFGIRLDRFELAQGSATLLLGPSGSGKSTLLSLLCGIAVPDQGTIEILGTDIGQLSGSARDRFRAEHIGIIFQMFNLLPYGSVLDNVTLPLSFAKKRQTRVGAPTAIRNEALRLLNGLGLGSEQCSGPASSLSVGQQQRVAVARALIGSPEIIIADEPTSALDKAAQARFLELLFSQVTDAGATLIMVSHDEGLAGNFDRVLQLHDIVRPISPAANIAAEIVE
jgi:putative ABC transport system ATP-binding protein